MMTVDANHKNIKQDPEALSRDGRLPGSPEQSSASDVTDSTRRTNVKFEVQDNDKENFDDEPPLSQQSLGLSQTDETIRRLHRDGEINNVVGSQSLLSQELYAYRNPGDDNGSEDAEDLQAIHSSQVENETGTSMAKRLGLLSQDYSDKEEEKKPEVKQAIKKEAPKVHPLLQQDEPEEEDYESQQEEAQRPAAPLTPVPQSASSSRLSTLRDTPIRQSQVFGSLLDAVQKLTEQEEVDGVFSHAVAQEQLEEEEIPPPLPSPRKRKSSPAEVKGTKAANKRKKKLQQEQEAQERAKRAAGLAEQTVANPEMAKRLLLSMALVRENPRSSPETWPARGSVVQEGFFWAHYPPLEAVLKAKMEKYYELSTTKCQSAHQQIFNNGLVVLVKEAAKEQGWSFDTCFSDKSLRDRIRCYYKTHIQNAKKRLKTMIRNPTKRANAKHLCEHLDLIEQHKNEKKEMEKNAQSDDDTAAMSDEPESPDTLNRSRRGRIRSRVKR
eukprot:CAMPEP_0113625116 /NCGR_PEP_ID=MMETSP0017_2-20120614/12970_1 /TAXON_ID=2856 /ORGANISM="Cylindrotheca closterium" /LENGTH=496 /DNA_ID=CAMNT_0000535213 /DNA_START=202 /DNA_END=1692 /DNA_ORIENTATION=+ /assembly_acc=CAM_ASM_000147